MLGRYYGFTESDIGKLTPRQVRIYMNQMGEVERIMNGGEEAAEVTDQDIIAEAKKFRLKTPVKR